MLKRVKKMAVCFIAAACMFAAVPAAAGEETKIGYRFADASEAAEMLLANRDYYESLTQKDLDFRMQHTGASLGELEAFVPEQMRDFTEEEKQAVEKGIETIEAICKERGYHLPELDGIVFAKSTMEEECGAGAYTHGTEIYLGEWILNFAMSGEPVQVQYFNSLLAHELFHCLTRSHPEFREAMYGILGFTVTEKDYEFGPDVRERIISNPDVEHHNSYASFEIGGKCGTVRSCLRQENRSGRRETTFLTITA